MGALLHKPSQASYRSWELTSISTSNYLEFTLDKRLNVLLFANRAVRILSSFNWISDRIRYSYDGFYKQRLVSCFYKNKKVSWFTGLSVLSELLINKKVVLHWSAIEPNCINDIYEFLRRISLEVSLPFSDFSTTQFLKNNDNVNNYNTFKWSLKSYAPTLLEEKTTYLNKLTRYNQNILAIPTSLAETEVKPLFSDFNFFDTDKEVVSVLVQTEQLTTTNNSVYFGTHGFLNASNVTLVIPSLLPYERQNNFTGFPFLKGPKAAKSYHEVTTILMQLYSLAVGNWAYRRKKSFRYKFISKNYISFQLPKYSTENKLTLKKFENKNALHFLNLQPELIVSQIQCLIK